MMIEGNRIKIEGRVVKTARLEDEWLNCVKDPEACLKTLTSARAGADCFTFRQNVGDTEPKYSYPMEWESLAVIPIATYEQWLNRQINNGAKRAVKKAVKKGVEAREVPLSEEFLLGVTKIINETPIRQGRPYVHYGKSAEGVRAEFAKDSQRFNLIGAFLDRELIGFIQLGHGDGYVVPFGMVSLIQHRDKSPQNALLAKAVEFCAERGIRYILYGMWMGGGLGDFKQNNGCVEMRVPRYYLPVTVLGKISCHLKLYRGVSGMLPTTVLERAITLRRRWYAYRFGTAKD